MNGANIVSKGKSMDTRSAAVSQSTADAVWSFRDPAGNLIAVDDRILRVVKPAFRPDVEAVLKSQVIQRFVEAGKFVRTTPLSLADDGLPPAVRQQLLSGADAEVLEHERIWFQSFPSEWPAEMLQAAGELTLDLAEGLLAEQLGLKDGTPFNVLFRGTEPVFIDVLSVERRDPHNPVWMPYAQFVRTFLLPLLVARHLSVPIGRTFLANREGLEPEEVYRSIGWGKRVKPPFLELVSMPSWLSGRGEKNGGAMYRPRPMKNAEQTRFVLRGLLRRLRRAMHKVRPREPKSFWSEYTTMTHYSAEEMDKKMRFVLSAVADSGARKILDVGCNTGRFSVACAEAGRNVVAIDSDPAVIGALWREGSRRKVSILPLVVNIAQPTPPTGWRNRECPSFLERACGSFEMVMMLALIHHLLVTERVPLLEILRLASELTRDAAVIEFVPFTDPMFQRLLRGRDELHRDFTQHSFEQACGAHFRIIRKEQLAPGSRCLYLLRK